MVPWKGETNYIDIYHTGGCGSWLGMTGGQQTLFLGGGCANTVGTPIHEVMHAIGTSASYSVQLNYFITSSIKQYEVMLIFLFLKVTSTSKREVIEMTTSPSIGVT